MALVPRCSEWSTCSHWKLIGTERCTTPSDHPRKRECGEDADEAAAKLMQENSDVRGER